MREREREREGEREGGRKGGREGERKGEGEGEYMQNMFNAHYKMKRSPHNPDKQLHIARDTQMPNLQNRGGDDA